MNRTDLVREVANKLNLTHDFTRQLISAYETTIFEALNSGEDICLSDFLTFKIKLSGGTHRWSIKANDKVFVPLKYKLFVKPTGKLKTSIEEQTVSKRERMLHNSQNQD